MSVHVADHPLIKHKLGLMREKDISTKDFRDLSSEVARLLTYEATKDLETQPKTIQGWAGDVEVQEIKGKKNNHCPDPESGAGYDGRRSGYDPDGEGQCRRVLPQ